jgi:anti-sigma factor RsiW
VTDDRTLDPGLSPDMLSAYLDGELTDAERAAVETQLASSPEWREELTEVRAARDALRGLPEREAPGGFWDSVLANVAAADDDVSREDEVVIPLATARSTARSTLRRRWTWVAASAAAVAAVVAIVVVPHRSEVSPNVAAVVAQHGAQGSDHGDPVSMLAPVGPLTGFRR